MWPDEAGPRRGDDPWADHGAAVRTRCYRNGQLCADAFPLDQVSDHLGEADALVWVDLCMPRAEELTLVAEELGLHPLAVEDALQRRQRPKLDRYSDHVFLTAYAVRLNADGALDTRELSVFATRTALVTVHGNGGFSLDPVVERWDANADLAKAGVAFLLHGLLDYLVDTHFAATQALDEEIEGLEDLLFAEDVSQPDLHRRTFQLRKSLVVLRRVLLPMREVLNTLLRRDLAVVEEPLVPYFQDVYDNVLRATEWTESLRDLVTSALETNLTIQGNRLSVISKKITSWAAIIAVPTAITGFYGQNVPYPGYGQLSGFLASTALIGGISGLLYWLFRRNDWL